MCSVYSIRLTLLLVAGHHFAVVASRTSLPKIASLLAEASCVRNQRDLQPFSILSTTADDMEDDMTDTKIVTPWGPGQGTTIPRPRAPPPMVLDRILGRFGSSVV